MTLQELLSAVTPLPEVIELPVEAGWEQWDLTVKLLDLELMRNDHKEITT